MKFSFLKSTVKLRNVVWFYSRKTVEEDETSEDNGDDDDDVERSVDV